MASGPFSVNLLRNLNEFLNRLPYSFEYVQVALSAVPVFVALSLFREYRRWHCGPNTSAKATLLHIVSYRNVSRLFFMSFPWKQHMKMISGTNQPGTATNDGYYHQSVWESSSLQEEVYHSEPNRPSSHSPLTAYLAYSVKLQFLKVPGSL
jgi:hypothetical protein